MLNIFRFVNHNEFCNRDRLKRAYLAMGYMSAAIILFAFTIIVLNVFFAYFRQDDYFFIEAAQRGFLGSQIWLFENWMGRPVSSFIIMLPGFFEVSSRLLILQFSLLIPFLAFCYASYRLFDGVARASILVIYFLLIYILSHKAIDVSVYWSSAVHTYQTGIAFLFLGVVLIIKARSRTGSVVGILFVCLAAGCNQLIAVASIIVYFVALCWFLYKRRFIELLLIPVCLFLVYVVLFEAGGRQRYEYTGSFQSGIDGLLSGGWGVVLTSLKYVLFLSVPFFTLLSWKKFLFLFSLALFSLMPGLFLLFVYEYSSKLGFNHRVFDFLVGLNLVGFLLLLACWTGIGSRRTIAFSNSYSVLLVAVLTSYLLFGSNLFKETVNGKNYNFSVVKGHEMTQLLSGKLERIDITDANTRTLKEPLGTDWLLKTYVTYWGLQCAQSKEKEYCLE